MLSYSQLEALPSVAQGTMDDGYNGHRRQVTWCYDSESQKIMVQHGMGFCSSVLPLASDMAEAKWLLLNHPAAKSYRFTVRDTEE